jgi:hypothetical protein
VTRRTAILGALLHNRRVRRLELAFAAFNVAEYGVWVAVLVYAYERGGATAASIVAVAQLLPAGLVAPVAARAVDRSGAEQALRAGYCWQSGTCAVTGALLLTGAPALTVYAAAILAACAVTATRPAQAALVPALARDEHELTAITVLSGWVESVSVLAGPAMAGLLIGLDGPGAAVALFAGCTGLAALTVSGSAFRFPSTGAAETRVTPASGAGLRALREDRGLAALVVLVGSQYLVIGVLDVVLVVLAIGVLGMGASGAGYLTAAFGAGGVIGSLIALSLIGRRRLAAPLGAAAIGWSVVLVMLGAWPSVAAAFLLLAAAGAARSLLDTSGRTILLRAAPPALRGCIFGLLEALAMFGLAAGSALVPAMVALGGAGAALVITGALLAGIALAAATAVHRVDTLGAVGGVALVADAR